MYCRKLAVDSLLLFILFMICKQSNIYCYAWIKWLNTIRTTLSKVYILFPKTILLLSFFKSQFPSFEYITDVFADTLRI